MNGAKPGTTLATIDSQYISQRQGKPFVAYVGLLDAAHRAGLVSITTELLQPPSELNGQTCICFARAQFEDKRVFTGIGDANPRNVGATIAVHAIRMAETRAKARALRDALNIAGASLEELGGDDGEDIPVQRTTTNPQTGEITNHPRQQWPPKPAPVAQDDGALPATSKMYKVLVDLINRARRLGEQLSDPSPNMTVAQARELKAFLEGVIESAMLGTPPEPVEVG